MTPAEGLPNPDLWELYAKYQIPAKWPNESPQTPDLARGAYIGLMQVQTTTYGRAWDWHVNTQAAVDLFSGAESPNKMSIATTNVDWIINGKTGNDSVPAHKNQSGPPLQPLTGQPLENMALVLYSGIGQANNPNLATTMRKQYYIPVCPPPGAISKQGNNWKCSTQWYWAVNDPAVDPNVIASNVFPPGVSGAFGNALGVKYVSNPLEPNNKGVRDQLQ